MTQPDLPEVMGVIRAHVEETHEEKIEKQHKLLKKKYGLGELNELLRQGDTWKVG